MSSTQLNNATKSLIIASMLKLMKTKPLDKIRVNEIIEDCQISRHTFYYHFNNIYDAVFWEFERILNETFSEDDSNESVEENAMEMIDFFRANQDLCKSIIESKYHSQIEQIIYEKMENIIRNEYCKNNPQWAEFPQEKRELLVRILAISEAGCVKGWLLDQFKASSKDMIDVLMKMMKGLSL
jgi:AcrR family transcriptional regulator